MRITPLDVRKQEFRKVVRGLDPEEVYAFLATVAEEYETVLTDNKQLRERVLELDEKVTEYRNMEKTLRDTLLTAERVMAEARENARKEGELILRDAHLRAEHEIANISSSVQELRTQLRELRGQRDGFLARLRGLAEAQIGLVESFANDFRQEDAGDRLGSSGPRATAVPPARPAAEPPRSQVAATPADEFPWDVPPSAPPSTSSIPPASAFEHQVQQPLPQRPAPGRPAPYAPEPSEQDRWRDYEPGRPEDSRAQRAAAMTASIAAVERAVERFSERPTERVARPVPRPLLEQPTAAPAYPPIAPVDTRIDTFGPPAPPFGDEAQQVADSVVHLAAEAEPAERRGQPPSDDEYGGQQPWSLTAAAGQSVESVAPYAADLQEAPAPRGDEAAPEAPPPRPQTGWSRWAIDKFNKALGDH